MKIVNLTLPEKCRLIAVSDIHTSCDLLEKMLEKANYNPDDDYLVIVGDILEHWNNNINTLRYVKKLCDNSEKAYMLMGNNDTFCWRMAYTYEYKRFSEKFYYNDNTFYQMAKSVGYDYCDESNWLDIRKAVLDKYGEMLEFMRNLPTCLETQDYVFVHAGVENRTDWRNTDDNFAITKPWFLREENPTEKWLVVGHFPTYNYKRSNSKNLPIIDENKKLLILTVACQLRQLVR